MSTYTEAYGLKSGDEVTDVVKECPEWIKLGCGDNQYNCAEKGATFTDAAQELPDIAKHNNICAKYFQEHPEKFAEYKDLKTSNGNMLHHCIKTGIDNPGHPHILTVGLVACDEECFTLFKDLFDYAINVRHNGFGPDAKHMSDMDASKLSQTPIDPDGKYVLTTRCRTGRSIKGESLPPRVTFEGRRKQEKMIVDALLTLEGELKGEYCPLRGSKSWEPQPNGMSEELEEKLRKNGNLFQEPDSTLLLSSGCGRHWPDARGIFKNEAENFFVWVNEEDQMRIVSMQKGDAVKEIFQRFATATQVLESKFDFMHNDHLGYVLTCPSNLGTGLRAGAMVKVPKFSERDDFKDILKQMKLQARGTAGVDSASTGGTWDISNADRLGGSEVQLVNRFIEGVAQVILWEKALEANADALTEEVIAEGVKKVLAASPIGNA